MLPLVSSLVASDRDQDLLLLELDRHLGLNLEKNPPIVTQQTGDPLFAFLVMLPSYSAPIHSGSDWPEAQSAGYWR